MTKLIWNGIEFLEVSDKEADRLVREDKAQSLSDGFVDGLNLKTRAQFRGYSDKMLAARNTRMVAKQEEKVEEQEKEPKKLPEKSGYLSKKVI